MVTKEEAKKSIHKLVLSYSLKSPQELKAMNEETVKKNYILPLFKALGWGVDSDEVTAEEKVSKKRVDYGFKISGMTKFFLEAKKPSEDVITDINHIRQAINYSYWQSVTWAVLTNFQDLIVFNAEWKGRNLSENRFITLNYKEFIDKFDDLWLLSRESFEKNLIDEKAVTVGKKQKREQIGDKILNDMIEWRTLLTKNINKYDHKLDEETLDEAVQRILDRLIFIKSCEDREIESVVLLAKARQWQENWTTAKKGLWEELIHVFRHFDSKYNSKLFEPHICENIKIDNEVINKIINELNGDEAGLVKYDFSAIPADILGNIYEQYLGHILKKSQKTTKVIEKHAHRKEQGIYYTPTYIVDYIVKNTVVEYAKDKNLDEIIGIKILDPACGSGSFIIKAYSTLLELVEKRLEKKETSKHWQSFKSYSGRLSLPQKIAILIQCIHGVDLDTKAVEIAQLNLLLKLLEGETKETLSNLNEIKKLLPMLNNNIKCGNSLIDDEKIAEDKAFKWDNQFHEIMKNGGFDIVIGNPPYGYRGIPTEQVKKIYSEKFETSEGNFDMYRFFIERSLSILKDRGLLGFIIPNTFLTAISYKKLRKYILYHSSIKNIVDLGLNVFEGVTLESTILISKKILPNEKNLNKINIIICRSRSTPIIGSVFNYDIPQEIFTKSKDNTFNIYLDSKISKIIEKIERGSIILEKIAYVTVGINTGYIKKILVADEQKDSRYHKLLSGRDIARYSLKWPGQWILYDKKVVDGYGDKGRTLPEEKIFLDDKILVQRTRRGMARKLICTLDTQKFYNLNRLSNIVIEKDKFDIKFCLGILNSMLMDFYFQKKFNEYEVKPVHLRQLPIKNLNLSQQKNIVNLVDKILTLRKHLDQLGDNKTDKKIIMEKEIRSADSEIDKLVYDIYDITEDEKKVIENSLK